MFRIRKESTAYVSQHTTSINSLILDKMLIGSHQVSTTGIDFFGIDGTSGQTLHQSIFIVFNIGKGPWQENYQKEAGTNATTGNETFLVGHDVVFV